MATNTAENTNLRLKAVLDILAEGVWSGETLNAGAVLAEAAARVPFDDHEGQLLSGGIPRGHKTLTSATAKLVKAGWLVKGRSGWTITEEGLRAIVAFPDAASFASALESGTPVPADVPVPEAPVGTTLTAKKPATKAPAKKAAKGKVAEKAAKLIEEVVKPVTKAVKGQKETEPQTEAAAVQAGTPAVALLDQPSAVAVAGDFSVLLGAPENWAPQYDEVQMKFDPADQLWKFAEDLPAGGYSFKIALNRTWDENYGQFGTFDGPNHEVNHHGGQLVIHYDHATRDIRFI